MKFNICSNIDNSAGLESDYKLLRSLLESWGHRVNGVHYARISNDIEAADVNIFLEVIAPPIMSKARHNWFIPNPEWYCTSYDSMMLRMNKILCKTWDAHRTFSAKWPDKTVHVGFESRDLFDESVPRKRKFLHVAGKSAFKNSEAVAYAFGKYFDCPWDPAENRELIFVGVNRNLMNAAIDHKNVTYIQHATPEEFKWLMNGCLFHIMPSQAEGWGHAIHEGLGCGAVMITTDFPPMKEFIGAHEFVSPNKTEACCLGRRAFVSAVEIRDAVDRLWKLRPDQIADAQIKAFKYFADQRVNFRQAFKQVVDSAI